MYITKNTNSRNTKPTNWNGAVAYLHGLIIRRKLSDPSTHRDWNELGSDMWPLAFDEENSTFKEVKYGGTIVR